MAERFTSHLEWTGADRGPTIDPASFSRDLRVALGPRTIDMSSAPAFRGDPARANPEQLFVAALSACQTLTYLFLAAKNGIGVVAYVDEADGWLERSNGTMRMSRVILRPHIVLQDGSDAIKARDLVDKAHTQCFIGNSVTTNVSIEPSIEFAAATTLVA